VTINIPPLSGPHTGSTTYAEALVSYPYKTSFIQLLGVNRNQTVSARAVAGINLTPAVGIMALQQNGTGISVMGNPTLSVDAAIVDNSTSATALSVAGNAKVYATKVSVSGGASISGGATVAKYPSGGGASPLTQNTGVSYTDPLVNVPTPTTSNGVVNTNYGTLSGSPPTLQSSASPSTVNVSGSGSVTLLPGIYQAINISGSGSVTFSPGVYVLAGGGMTISGSTTISGNGVMFYNTSSNYNRTTGVDGSGGTFGAINISGSSSFGLTGISNSSSPYNAMLIFQDPANTNTVTVTGSSTGGTIFTGTIYAPTANFSIAGSATYNSAVLAGSVTVAGNSSNFAAPATTSSGNLVYLVE
jgi:hypothetical protein